MAGNESTRTSHGVSGTKECRSLSSCVAPLTNAVPTRTASASWALCLHFSFAVLARSRMINRTLRDHDSRSHRPQLASAHWPSSQSQCGVRDPHDVNRLEHLSHQHKSIRYQHKPIRLGWENPYPIPQTQTACLEPRTSHAIAAQMEQSQPSLNVGFPSR